MNLSLIKVCLTRLLPGLLVCVLLGGAGWALHHAGYNAGHAAAKADGDAALAREQKARSDERQALTQAHLQALLVAQDKTHQQQQRADALAEQLADKTAALARTEQQLRLNIHKAVSDDNKTADSGCGYNGIGPHSLQLYEQALGYGDARPRDSGGH
ncbi:TPA: hypothetical protein H2X23_000152 [Salmonella enterica]|uniref:Uncharacterized protein n=1 Tax=Salmonella newport TaxID=108619 RepID=A0A5W5VT61_SALNE|nr:hypothetical protein [Salmonella enterica subsp. enterica serovar Newport]EDQ9668231.1 hypothetical protein [Salmonella enterica subsp. enterica serovar Bredeney]HAK8132003.1 hypothetical protein [Salmonella enterica]HAK8523223.1 hypothetical protein [Salmonella enterica]HAK8665724.1 hypothetical protein [Salmonella enterica]